MSDLYEKIPRLYLIEGPDQDLSSLYSSHQAIDEASYDKPLVYQSTELPAVQQHIGGLILMDVIRTGDGAPVVYGDMIDSSIEGYGGSGSYDSYGGYAGYEVGIGGAEGGAE